MKHRKSTIVWRTSVGLICLSLLLGLLWGYFHFWSPQLNPSENVQPIASLGPQPTTEPSIRPTVSGKWSLAFDDEFSGPSLDTHRWNIEDYEVGGYRNCCLNYGKQYYTPQALSFANGSLQINTERRAIGSRDYTSGAITTENKFSFLYGRVDIRVKLPKTPGFWPAVWLLPYGTDAKLGGVFEIDVMEYRGLYPNVIHMANHWGKQQAYHDYTGGPDYSQGYHVFSLVWTPQTITWYIDGIARFQVSQHISNRSMYLIINSAMGGSWGGLPNASTVLPQSMDIDYVRVYKSAP